MTGVNFQAAASLQGRAFEDFVESALTFYGWDVTGRHVVVGDVEVDLVATDPDGQQWWIECKGSHRGHQPGARRSDTVKKAVGVAYHLSGVADRLPYMLVTSHLPRKGSVGDRMLAKALADGLFTRIKALSFDDQESDDIPDEGDTQ